MYLQGLMEEEAMGHSRIARGRDGFVTELAPEGSRRRCREFKRESCLWSLLCFGGIVGF